MRFVYHLAYSGRFSLQEGLILDYIYSQLRQVDVPKSTFLKGTVITNKPVPLQAWSGPEGSRKLRFPDFMTTAQEGGKVVSLTHRPHVPPGNSTGTHFC